jgi:hypothetical protein
MWGPPWQRLYGSWIYFYFCMKGKVVSLILDRGELYSIQRYAI